MFSPVHAVHAYMCLLSMRYTCSVKHVSCIMQQPAKHIMQQPAMHSCPCRLSMHEYVYCAGCGKTTHDSEYVQYFLNSQVGGWWRFCFVLGVCLLACFGATQGEGDVWPVWVGRSLVGRVGATQAALRLHVQKEVGPPGAAFSKAARATGLGQGSTFDAPCHTCC